MYFACSGYRGEYLLVRRIDDYLRLDRMPLLLSRVVSALFFWGRSMGDSVQSMVSFSMVGSSKAADFLGSANALERTSMFSCRRTILKQFDSLTP